MDVPAGLDDSPGDGADLDGACGSRAGPAGRLVQRWVPDALLTGGPSPRRRRVAILTALVGVAGVVVLAVLLFGGGPAAEMAPPLPPAEQTARASPAAQHGGQAPPAAAQPTQDLVVSVVGKVRAPGLVTVPPGARVADAVQAAGGADGGVDLGTVNLARRLTDGEQIYVGVPVPPGMQPAPAAAPGAAAQPSGKVNLNTAGLEQLKELPGVGDVTAQRILEWRTRHGGFTAVEQLREIEGIGEKRFGRLRDQVSVQ